MPIWNDERNMSRKENKHYLEIMPAAMLSHRRAWQGVARGMPPGGYLIVVNPKSQQQINLARRLTRNLQQEGKQIVLWFVDERLS